MVVYIAIVSLVLAAACSAAGAACCTCATDTSWPAANAFLQATGTCTGAAAPVLQDS